MVKSLVNKKRGQAGTEYLIVVGFVTFAIMVIVAIALTVSNNTKDRLKVNQLESYMDQLINSAESVYFSGEPSKSTISLYLPEGINEIRIFPEYVVVKMQLSSGENIRVFDSRVPLSSSGSVLVGEGTKKVILQARATDVLISPAS